MRVVAVTPWYPDSGDGAGSFVEDHIRVISRVHEVAVVHLQAARSGPALIADATSKWPVIRCSPRIPANPGTHLLRDVVGLAGALRLLRRRGFRPQLLHAHVYNTGLAAVPAARALGIPLVVSEHLSAVALGRVEGRARLAASAAYRWADLVSPVSDSMRTAVEDVASATRTEVVPNPVDTDLFAPPARARVEARSPRRVLAVTSFVPVKGVDTLLEAVASLVPRRSDFRLRIVGDGPGWAARRRQAEAAGIADRVDFLGRLAREEVAATMRDADFLVVASRWETFSVATAEALCCGLPVLATAVGALPELVDPSSGQLVEPESPAALAAGIDRMLASAAGFDRPAIARRAVGLWGAQAVADAWSAIYTELASAR